MFDGNVGGVPGNSDVQWNRKLAEELDAADGKKDGKISASVWNGFIKKVGSSGNKVDNFININNAEKSFGYYANTKDKDNVDWSNWKELLADFKKDLEQADKPEEPVNSAAQEVHAEEESVSESEQILKSQAEFDSAMSKSPLANVSTMEDFSKIDMSKYTLVEDRGPGTSRFINPETNESILLETDESGKNTKITYTNGNITHTIVLTDGKFSGGQIAVKQTDGTEEVYDCSKTADGQNVMGLKNTENSEKSEFPSKEELKDVVSQSPITKDTMPTEEELLKAGYKKTGVREDGSVDYENPETGEKIWLTPILGKQVYGSASCVYTKGDISVTRLYSHQTGKAATDGGEILLKGAHFGVFKVQPETGELAVTTLQDEIQDKFDKSILSGGKFPTEQDLKDAGFEKTSGHTTNGQVLYKNPETGESILINLRAPLQGVVYTSGDIRIEQFYDEKGVSTSGDAQRIEEDGEDVNYVSMASISVNPETGKMEVRLNPKSEPDDAPEYT